MYITYIPICRSIDVSLQLSNNSVIYSSTARPTELLFTFYRDRRPVFLFAALYNLMLCSF